MKTVRCISKNTINAPPEIISPIVHQFMIKTCIINRSYLTLYIFFSGNTDIHNGNLKLILALLWSLIANYQLGASNFPPKKLMLEWLKVSTYKLQRKQNLYDVALEFLYFCLKVKKCLSKSL